MNKINNMLKLRLIMLYFTLYGTMGCYYPYLPLYLENRRLSYTQMGIVFALNSLTGIIAQPIWGYVTDKRLTKRKTLFTASVFCSLLAFNFLAARSFSYILVSMGLLTIFQSITSPMCDAYCYEVIDRTGSLSFGQVRLMGSIGFAAVSLILGRIIQLTDINASILLYSALFAVTAYLVSGIKTEEKSGIKRPGIKDVLNTAKQLKFMIFIFSVLLINIALGANSSYLSVLVKETGGNASILGFVWFIVAMSEIPAFFFGNRLMKRFGVLNVYLFAAGLFALRFFLCSAEQSYQSVIAIQLMQSVTYPLYLTGAMQYVNMSVPEHIKASGITLISSLGFGLGSFIGNLYGGMLVETRGIYYLYRAMAIFCILSLITGICLKFTHNSPVQKEEAHSFE